MHTNHLTKVPRAQTQGFAWTEKNMAYLGFSLGVGLILIATVLDIVSRELSLTFESVRIVYEQNVAHWIILTSPVVLTAVFLVVGKMVGNRDKVIVAQRREETEQSLALEKLITHLQDDNFEVNFSDKLDNKEVAAKLESLRKKLAADKVSEQQRTWENQGLAAFGDLLRKETDSENLTFQVLRFLVKYVNANQGSVFLLDNTSQALELKACYAYDKKKFVAKTIPVGQGLVGQCFLERETILLYDVPADYIKITSGLGLANPSCVVIVPLRHNDSVLGVVELASFTRLEKFQFGFIEKCAAAFASVVQSVTVNENVKQLLHTSQEQMQQLRAQEEEMRQNMEELQAIQEQMTRQLEENINVKNLLEARENVLAQTTILSESDLFGTITYVNPKFIEVSGYSSEELIGRGHNIVRHPDMPKELFQKLWSTIKSGKTFRGIVKNRKKDGGIYWVDATIVPIFHEGEIVKYIGARYHITDERMAERLYERQMKMEQLTAISAN